MNENIPEEVKSAFKDRREQGEIVNSLRKMKVGEIIEFIGSPSNVWHYAKNAKVKLSMRKVEDKHYVKRLS